MIRVEHLSKAFGIRSATPVPAVQDVSFEAPDGEITGLLGPNGAGKTTLLRMLATLIVPDAGSATVNGLDVVRDRYGVRSKIGVLSDARGLYPRLTTRENIRYYGALHGLSGGVLESRIDALVDALGLSALADRRTAGFSQGEKMKVAIARALVHDPAAVLLDEPTNGLDIMSVRALREQLRQLRGQGKCLLFSSHVMQEVAALCDRIVILGAGRVVASGTSAELMAQAGAAHARGCLRGAAGHRRGPGRVKNIVTVALKELLDTFRDRRTLLVTLLPAVVAGPLVLLLMFSVMASQIDKVRELKLPTVGREYAPALVAFLERQQVTLTTAPADHEAKIRAGELDVVLVIDANFERDVAGGKAATVRLIYDRSRDRAQASIREVEGLLRAYSRQWGSQRLLLRGIAPTVGNPLDVESTDLATPQQSGAFLLFFLAYYGLFAAVMGGMAVALDVTAGERERQSLEPLLMTPARPAELVVGKWAAAVAFDALIVIVTLAGYYLTLRFAPLPAVGIPFLFSARELAWFLLVLVPLIALLPAILLFMGARSRTYKEAQASVSLVIFVVSIIPVVQLIQQKKEPDWISWIPVSGQFSLLSQVLRGESPPLAQLATSFATPAMLTIGLLLLVSRMLSRESILAGK